MCPLKLKDIRTNIGKAAKIFKVDFILFYIVHVKNEDVLCCSAFLRHYSSVEISNEISRKKVLKMERGKTTNNSA